MSIDELDLGLLIGAAVLITAIAAVRLSARTNFPTLLLYLGLGVLLGEDVLGVHFNDAEIAGVLGYAALILILAEGGLTTRWDSVRASVAPAAVLATVGTLVSIGVTGTAAVLLLDVSWTLGMLIGAVLASTDAAAVFSVLRRVPLPRRLGGILEAESGFNDAPVVIAVVALTHAADHTETHALWYYLLEGAAELAIGAAVGLAVGWVGAQALRRVGLPSSGLYPIAVLALIVLAYGGAATLHGSGFLATYLCSLVLGNMRLPHGSTIRGFAEGFGWMAQIGLFVLLGLLAVPSRLDLQTLVRAIGVGLVLLLVARPLSVVASVTWFRVPWREQAFLSWAGLRGAVPIVLATVPMAAGLAGSEAIFDLVFVLVIVFTLVQAPTLPFVARKLRVSDPAQARELDVDVSPLGAISADVLQVRIGEESKMHGIEVFELRLPQGVNVTLILRGDETLVPGRRTVLRHGDDLVVVAPTQLRDETEDQLRAVHLNGKLARWRGAPPPAVPPSSRKEP
jgi:cell volume regulation protein A